MRAHGLTSDRSAFAVNATDLITQKRSKGQQMSDQLKQLIASMDQEESRVEKEFFEIDSDLRVRSGATLTQTRS
jgi:hypothetical protein